MRHDTQIALDKMRDENISIYATALKQAIKIKRKHHPQLCKKLRELSKSLDEYLGDDCDKR